MISAWNCNPAILLVEPEETIIGIEPGDRIAQLVFTRVTQPTLTIRDGEEAPQPGKAGTRGTGGFGSTGRR